MDKMKMQSKDRTQENFEKLAALFPNAVTETITGYDEDGNAIIERAIDKDVLQQEISAVVVEGRDERYQFTWPDKKKSILAANAPIRKTLRPCREESVDFDNTENLYIEGDNLDVLKLLQETYLGKVKMIYIDPPYNTGHDFVYSDAYSKSNSDYRDESGDYDEEGNRLFQNTTANGRFHTDWLNMLYPRLKIARDLLSDDGVIFISIDNNEVENLKKICNELFGESNFIANIVWKHTQQSKNDEPHFSRQYNQILLYAKSKGYLSNFYFARSDEDNKNYSNPDNDPKGMWRSGDVRSPSYRSTLCYSIVAPNGKEILPPANGWRWTREKVLEKIETGEIKFKPDYSGIIRKIYLCDQPGRTPENLWEGQKFGTTRQAAAVIKDLFDGVQVFETPKPIELVKAMIEITTSPDSYIMDFFSGSATTAHAVMLKNAQDSINEKVGKRKFIMVQLPEPCDEKSEAYKAGYKTVSDLGKERIRRAGKRIQHEIELAAPAERAEKETGNAVFLETEETIAYGKAEAAKLDVGFRVLKLDSTNMKDVYYNPHDVQMSILDQLESNIKEDRTPEDLLFQVMLDLGVLLSSKIEESTIAGKKVFNVADNFLIACFDEDVSDETITAVAKLQPAYFVMRDSSMKNDSVATNFDQIFATYSPDTVRKVL